MPTDFQHLVTEEALLAAGIEDHENAVRCVESLAGQGITDENLALYFHALLAITCFFQCTPKMTLNFVAFAIGQIVLLCFSSFTNP